MVSVWSGPPSKTITIALTISEAATRAWIKSKTKNTFRVFGCYLFWHSTLLVGYSNAQANLTLLYFTWRVWRKFTTIKRLPFLHLLTSEPALTVHLISPKKWPEWWFPACVCSGDSSHVSAAGRLLSFSSIAAHQLVVKQQRGRSSRSIIQSSSCVRPLSNKLTQRFWNKNLNWWIKKQLSSFYLSFPPIINIVNNSWNSLRKRKPASLSQLLIVVMWPFEASSSPHLGHLDSFESKKIKLNRVKKGASLLV